MGNVIDLEDTLKKIAKDVANKIANEARKELCDKYKSLLDRYYSKPPTLDKNGVPYYIRTKNLYKSYSPYKHELPRNRFVAGVYIHADKMKDYDSVKGSHDFSAERLLNKFIFVNPLSSPDFQSYTWHGGDWHGGYGWVENFSIYDEMFKYRDKLVKKYSNMKVRYEDYM